MNKKVLVVLIVVIALALLTLGVTGCEKAEELLSKAPENLAYDGQYITWNKVDRANYYTVSVNGSEAVRSNSTTYTYTSNEQIDVTVTAVFEKTEKSTTVTFKPLATIEHFAISDNGEVGWDSVAGANAYLVSINGSTKTVTDNHIDNLAEGSNRVKVKPIVSGDNTFYSFYSKDVNVYIYSAPSNITYDGTAVSWSGSSRSYEVTINGVTREVNGNSLAYNSDNVDFTIDVKALGNHNGTYDSKITSDEFRYLGSVTNIVVEDGIIKWNAVDNAEGYTIKIDGVIQKAGLTDTSYDKISAGKSYDISIMPYNKSGNYFASWSVEKNIYILETPVVSWNNDLDLDGEANNNITWNAVNAASGYTVRLTENGERTETFTYSELQRAFAHAYANVGVYTVEVKANTKSDNPDYCDGKYSTPITIERLPAPKATDNEFIVSDKDTLQRGFTVNFIRVSGATGYQMYKDGVKMDGKLTQNSALSDTNVVSADNISEQKFNYYIRSMGGIKSVKKQTYVTLPCLTREALSFEITVQATPQNPLMSGYMLFWDAVSGNNGYNVTYSGITKTAQSERFDLSTINAGSYIVSVSARGNGGAVLASTASAPVNIQRLEAPVNIRISSLGYGTLQWNDVSNARSYETYLDLSKTPLAESAYGNMYQFIETNGTTLSMIAVANYYKEDGTLYYMSSQSSPTQQFIRLSAPTFPEGALENSSELLWNTPSNINTSEYTPTYRVFSAIDEQIGGGDLNGTKFNIEYLEGGELYTFYVKAIGNDTKYLDSDYSVAITAYKIKAPEIALEDGKYVWNAEANATSYYLEIDGKKATDEFHVSGTKYSYAPRFETEGEHTVTIRALGDKRGNLDSADNTFKQVARILKAPVFTFEYSDDHFVTNGSIVVTITTPSANCSGYQYEIAGQSESSKELTFAKVIQTPGKYTVRVKALGASFDEDGVYYIDSQYAGGSTNDVINILSAPTTASIRITSDGLVKWDVISGAYGYEYQISFNGGDFGDVISSGNNMLSIENYTQYTSIKIRIRTKGDGNRTVSSDWAEWVWTNSKTV